MLARHGQTPANVAKLLDTVLPGPGLTDLGRLQAEALGKELATALLPLVETGSGFGAKDGSTAGLLETVTALRS